MSGSGWVLHNSDCLGPEGMSTLADGSVAHVATDAPYSEKVHTSSRRGSMRAEPGKGAAAYSRNRDLGFEHLSPEVRASSAAHFARLARRWVIVFCDVEGAHGWRTDLEAAGLNYVRTGAWIKEGATPQFTGDRPAVGFEAIVICHAQKSGRYRWNGGGRHAVWSEPIVLDRGGNEPRLHTTQKPLALMEALIRDFTDPGELILDPFAGSGTTGVACIRNGRNFIGWERDAGFYETARKRLEATREQEVLFGRRGPKPKQGALL